MEYLFVFVMLYLFGFPILAFILQKYQLSLGFVIFIVLVGIFFTPLVALIVLSVVLLYKNPPFRSSAPMKKHRRMKM